MPQAITIRPECEADVDAIASITKEAFRANPHSQNTEPFIIEALRGSGALSISLVAEFDGRLVGHVAFSPVQISDGSRDWYALGPIAVSPRFQRRGIGQALVTAGLDELRRLGARGCVLVGEPTFYERFGFRSDTSCTMSGVPQEYVLSLPLQGHAQAVGEITHHEAFHTPPPERG